MEEELERIMNSLQLSCSESWTEDLMLTFALHTKVLTRNIGVGSIEFAKMCLDSKDSTQDVE